MQIVIDSNIIMAMLIRPGKPIDLFFDNRLNICAPLLLFDELENNKDEIKGKSNLKDEEFDWLCVILKHNLRIFPEEDFLKYRDKAEIICPDKKDVIFFALALYLQCPMWTNEKMLKEQDDVIVYATHDLMKLF